MLGTIVSVEATCFSDERVLGAAFFMTEFVSGKFSGAVSWSQHQEVFLRESDMNFERSTL